MTIFLTFLCDFSRNSTPLVHPAKIKKPHNQAIMRLSVYPDPGSKIWMSSNAKNKFLNPYYGCILLKYK